MSFAPFPAHKCRSSYRKPRQFLVYASHSEGNTRNHQVRLNNNRVPAGAQCFAGNLTLRHHPKKKPASVPKLSKSTQSVYCQAQKINFAAKHQIFVTKP
ncbi:MAG: hypothetical protein CTY19_00365 [Methylomonas sp.]|nr:MAG: hypothetical protein CTY19_00365 [Methylomonas sp.]